MRLWLQQWQTRRWHLCLGKNHPLGTRNVLEQTGWPNMASLRTQGGGGLVAIGATNSARRENVFKSPEGRK